MASERQVQELLREWSETDVPQEDPAAAERRRRRVVASSALTIARVAHTRARAQTWVKRAVALASAAALVALGVGAWRAFSGAPHAAVDSPAAQMRLSGTVRAAGDDVMTDVGGRGELVLTDGVAITLEQQTRLRLPAASPAGVSPADEQVGLDVGSIAVRVPPLAAGHTFSIKTPDAQVSVHGTAFTVDVVPGAAASPMTHVRVSSGVVSVQSGGHVTVLTAGMDWASPVDVPAVAPPAVAPTSAAAPSHRPARTSSRAPETAPPPRDSSLGEENRLLASAMAAERGADHAGALRSLDELLRRFPGSPLAQEAHVQRFRVLSRAGDAEGASREAWMYLALYPDGFARDEAKRLAIEP
jgi:ferric-dicitrate binding protein FerR (iron transport regulator)